MSDERRTNAFCNLYAVHCKEAFEELKSDVKDIKRILVGTNGDSLVTKVALNTQHRNWMESWGRAILISVSLSAIGSFAWVIVNAK